jgi:hypothetical protein
VTLGAGEWARFAAARVAAKLHVVYDPDREASLFFEVNSGRAVMLETGKRITVFTNDLDS